MAVFTTQLRTLCASLTGTAKVEEFGDADRIISECWEDVFRGAWNTFDPSYKIILCRKILRHFWMREIGFETAGLFLHYLNTRLEEIMPYYNKLYESATYEFNPLHDYDLEHTSKRTNVADSDTTATNQGTDGFDSTGSSTNNVITNDKTTTTDNSTVQNINKFSDTPQGTISGVIEGNYLTNATVVDNSTEQTGDSITTVTTTGNQESSKTGTRTINRTETGKVNATTTEDYVLTIKGKSGGKSPAKMLTEYRDTLINIDLRIINELNDLFMGLWA